MARPRRARRSYANFFTRDASNEGNGHVDADGDGDASASDFEPAAGVGNDSAFDDDIVEEDQDIVMEDDEDDDDDLGSIIDEPRAMQGHKARGKTKSVSQKGKQEQGKAIEAPSGGPSLATASRPQRPGPGPSTTLLSKDHRHPPESPWYPPTEVFRLTEPPHPCSTPVTVPTISTGHPRVIHRVKKAWTHCVSAGPCWELLEDRAFFKEEYALYDPASGNGRHPRPVVYSELSGHGSQTILSATQAASYLPRISPLHCQVGPLASQQLLEFAPFSSVPMRLMTEDDQSHVFYPGGPVIGADWCPSTATNLQEHDGTLYFAISTLMERSARVPIGLRCPTPSPASIQIWSLGRHPDQTNPGLHVRGEMMLCIDQGCALQIKWCPLPSHDERKMRMGLLAAATMDGNVNIYSVPGVASMGADNNPSAPGFVYVKCDPIVRLSLPDTTCTTLDWANSELIAVGCADGAVAVFYCKDAISTGSDAVLTHHFVAHQSAVQNICWIRLPQTDINATPNLTEDPTMICTVGSEGSLKITDTRDCLPRALVRNREVPHSNAYSSFCGTVVATDVDFLVKMYQVQPSALGKGHHVMDIGGAALSVSTSDMHPFVAVGSLDGACTTTNILRGTRRERAVPLFNHKIFQLDYNPTTEHYRMLDHFLPKESGTSEGPAYRESAPKAKKDDPEASKRRYETGPAEPSALWPPGVAVNVVTWNSGCGLGNAPLLLSGAACGLARIDFLEGVWMRNTLPYGSVEMIRQKNVDDSGSESQSE